MNKNEEMRFTNFLREKAKEAERAIRYRPTYFLGMLETEGGYRTALKLLSSTDVSEGFIKLWEHRRLDLSVEALVVESEWRKVFEPKLIQLAEKRLKSVKYPFTRWGGGEKHSEAIYTETNTSVEVKRKVSMNRIVIAWPAGDEYIDIDLNELDEDTEIYFTKQTYDNGARSEIYKVSSSIRVLNDGKYEIQLQYVENENPDIEDSWWGTTRIVLHKDDESGLVSWHDQHHKHHDGNFGFTTVYSLEAEDSQRWFEEERALARRPDLEETVKQVLRNERRGQHIFREKILQCEPACRLTGVSDPAHLRASHIKPWAVSDGSERLDENNGLMLSPHIDHLFDRAYISFEDDGTLLVLNDKVEKLLQRWGIDRQTNPMPLKPFNSQQSVYLAHHRQRFTLLQQNNC